ncbi:MAG TPA: hypothetical protein DEP84_09490 [Chloroflexi bacterium]|nr:hypothetical protein [Chloroflexota bacterium]
MSRCPFASLRIRVLLLVLLTATPAFSLLFYRANAERQREIAEAQDDALRLARVISSQEQDLIDGTRQLLITLSRLSEVRGGRSNECQALLADVLAHHRRYLNFGVASSSGDVVCSALPFDRRESVADRAYFREAIDTVDFAAGEFEIGRITGKPSLNFGYPIFDDAGQIQGVIFAALDLERLSQLDTDVAAQLPPGSTLTKIDARGLIIARYPDPQDWIGHPAPAAMNVETIVAQGQGVIQAVDSHGVARLQAFSNLSSDLLSTTLYAILDVPEEGALAQINRIFNQDVSALGLITLLVIAVAWAGSDIFILGRVQALLKATQRLAAGDLSARTGMGYGWGELSSLARAFDQMADTLERREAERQQTHAELKRRADEFAALYETTHALTGQQDLPELLEAIVEHATTLLNAPNGYMYLYDSRRGEMELVAAINPHTPIGTRLALGEGVAGHIAQSRQPLIVDDYRSWEYRSHQFEGAPLTAAVGVPMLYSGELVGILGVGETGETVRKFTEAEARLLSLFAAQAASAVRNARLFDETRQRALIVDTLNRVGQRLSATFNLEEIVEILGQEAGNLLRPGNFDVVLYDEVRNEIEVRLYLDRGERMPGFRFAVGEGLVSHIVTHKEPILATEYLDECATRGVKPAGPGQPGKAWLGVPIVSGKKVLGALLVWDYDQEGSLTERDLRVLSTLAAQTAIAIANAGLYTDLQNALTIQSRLFDATTRIISQSDADAVLRGIVDSTRQAVAADQCNVMLIDANGYCYRWLGSGYQYKLEPHAMRPAGISLRVMRSRQPEFISDIEGSPLVNPGMRAEGIRSAACLPLRGKSGPFGVMWVNYATRRAFSGAEQMTFQTFANHAAVAVEQARLSEETRQRLNELEAVNRTSTALRMAQSLAEMLPIIVAESVAAVGASSGALWMYDASADELRQAVTFGPSSLLSTQDPPALKPGDGIVGRVFATGEATLSREFASDPRTHEPVRAQIRPGWGGAGVPIRTADQNQIVGVLLISVELPRQLTATDARLLSTIAEIAGNAIHRMRAHEQTVQSLGRLAALYSIDTAINASLDLRVTLGVLLDQIINHLKVDAADVLLFKSQTQSLEFAAGRGFHSRVFEQTRLRLGEGHAGRAGLERRIANVPDLCNDEGTRARAQWVAGESFVAFYGVPLVAKDQLVGVLEVFHRAPLTPDPEWLEFLEAFAGQAAIAIDNVTLFEELQRSNHELAMAYDATIEGWSRALDLRDKETEGHTRRVTELTLRLARSMGLGDKEFVHIRRGALLHDIGKMGVPDSILLKPGPLTDKEWLLMRKHPTYAYEMLAPIGYLRSALDIPYCHHEKWDGTGYPRGLQGEEIPLAARIFAVVDVWDALCSDRPYRPAWPKVKVHDYIRSLAGSHFDPEVVGVFLNESQRLD